MQAQARSEAELLEKLGYASLNPMQRDAVRAGLLTEPRMVVAAPTASGKTLVALLKIAAFHAQTKQKTVYVVPLRALAREKHDEFTKTLASLDLRVAVATGDFDSTSDELAESDVLIVTSEKMDSLLRHRPAWIDQIGLAVIDEAHVMNDEMRGATLEVVVTQLKRRGCHVLLLSATIANAKALADWIGGKLVQSTYRPTELKRGIATEERVFWENGEADEVTGRPIERLVRRALETNNNKGQALIFVSTRKHAESLAQALAPIASEFLTVEEKVQCGELGEKALKALNPPTSQCRALAACLQGGIAFHHAGLVDRDRSLIERGYKQARCLKVIVATTTLAMGIDYPASWVIVRDLKRFNGAYAEFIPNMEVQQMIGRAGRPKFDNVGHGVLLCAPAETRKVRDRYVLGELEDVTSKLGAEPALRSHSLALLASGNAGSFEDLFAFYNESFFAFQYGDATKLFDTVERVVGELKEMDFVRERAGALVATPVGRRVSELYVDPLSAHAFIEFMNSRCDKSTFAYFMAVNNATEARPLMDVKRDEESELWDEMYGVLSDEEAQRWGLDHEAVKKYKTAKVLNAWTNEESEERILEEYRLPPGVVHARVRIAEWLTYAFSELAFLLNQTAAFRQAKLLRRRIKHGVKEELLELTRFRGIGRVRARKLFNLGIRTAADFQQRSADDIKALLREKRENL